MAPGFDSHPSEYESAIANAIAFAGQPHERYVRAKVVRLLQLARRRLGDGPVDALDVGCGPGLTDRQLRPHVRSLAGVDIAPAMVERARGTNPDVDYRVADGASLPYEDGTFDLVFAMCVLHHVDAGEQPAVLAEMRRVSRPGGLVAVFEHNPLNPLTVKVVRSISFDEGVRLISCRELVASFRSVGLAVTDSTFMLFTPWRRLDPLEARLGWLPLGAQYVVAAQA